MLACDTCSKKFSGKCTGCELHLAELRQYIDECDLHVHNLFMNIMFRRAS